MQNEPTDSELMERIQKGDQLAFSTLVKRHLPRANSIARRTLTVAQDAEEALQDSFNKVWIKAKDFDSTKASFGTWFYRIIVNTCIDLARRKKPTDADIDSHMECLSDQTPTAEKLALEEQESQKIKNAVQSLPEKQRIAIILCYFEEMTNKEAAQIMGLNIKALEGLLVRGRKTLRGILDD